MNVPSQTQVELAVSLMALHDPRIMMRMFLNSLPVRRDCCVKCYKAIPPGKAGRSCPECRSSPA